MTTYANVGHILLKRGNTIQSTTHTGPVGELTFDTGLNTVRAHNGSTVGGILLATNGQSLAANANVGAFQTYANLTFSTQATLINAINANVTAANAAITSLTSNAAIQASILDTLTGNATTQAMVLDTLTSNAATQATTLTTLLSNAVTQQTSLTDLVANAAAQAQAIASVTGTYSNANVATYLSAFDGNIIPSANVTYSLGSEQFQWRDLWVSNNTIYIGNTPVRVDGGTLLVNGAPVAGTYGNTQVAEYLPTYTGNIAGNIVKSGYTWTFSNTGTTTFPTGVRLSNARGANTVNFTTDVDKSFQIETQTSTTGRLWSFGTDGNLTLPQNANINFSNGVSILSTVDAYQTYANANAATQATSIATLQTQVYANANVATYLSNYDGGINFTASPAVITGLGNISSANFTFANGVNILSTVGAGSYGNAQVASYLLNFDGDIEFTSSTAKIGNVDVITVGDHIRSPAYQFSNGASILSNVVTKVSDSWTVTTGTNTYSFTVSTSGTYQLWVDCNIPNGILAWNATATITNSNVPVVGAQYAWVYDGGGTPIDFTSIPNQFVGTANTIVRSNTAPSATTNRFDFGINNTSGGNVTVRYGWIAIS
jgi:hypothetical protein